MKTFTLEQIAQVTGGMLSKANDVAITNIAPPALADENTLALALGEDEIANLSDTKAKAALVPLGVNIDGFTTIEVERPRLAMMKLISMFYEEPHVNSGVHPSAVVHPTAKLGENVCLGANVVIGENAVIGNNTKILANCYIGNGAIIGDKCFFHPSVNIGDRVAVGNDVILHHGVSLGADGFSFVTENPSNIEQAKAEGEIKDSKEGQKIFEGTKICKNPDYQKHLNQISELKGKSTLLIHICCGVCSVYPLQYLRKYFNITIFFSNSNIYLLIYFLRKHI